MLKAETAKILQMCATFDQRTIGVSDVESWHSVLGRLSFETCRQAVIDHYSEHSERIWPADIKNLALRRSETFTPKTPALPDADPDDVPGYLEALRAGRGIELEEGPGIEVARLADVIKSLKVGVEQ